jgi:hypothetical protein
VLTWLLGDSCVQKAVFQAPGNIRANTSKQPAGGRRELHLSGGKEGSTASEPLGSSPEAPSRGAVRVLDNDELYLFKLDTRFLRRVNIENAIDLSDGIEAEALGLRQSLEMS